MRTQEIYTDYHDNFEYFGNTEIERVRMQGERVIKHDWIMFDSVDEAMEFFTDRCGEVEEYYVQEGIIPDISDISKVFEVDDIFRIGKNIKGH